MKITYRKSTTEDGYIIDVLMQACFGDGYQYNSLNDLDNRYLLAFYDDKLIAMTGLCKSLDYVGYEIDWTCLLPEYRGQGIVTNMIREVIKDCIDDVYCSCWRFANNENTNMYYAMKELGFVCVVKEHKKYDARYHQVCFGCIKISAECKCCEDLYVKRKL